MTSAGNAGPMMRRRFGDNNKARKDVPDLYVALRLIKYHVELALGTSNE